jgi:hypothetical protein
VSGAVTRFARTLAGNDELNVRVGADAESSDDEVVVDPALFQAAYARRAPVTPDEVALASALHEVVHLVSTDLDEPRELPDHWFGEGREAPDGEFDLLDGLRRAGGSAAEGLFFAIEDARQERQGLAAYPGARSVLTDLYHSALPRALAEATMLGQFTVACFMLLGDHLDRDTLERRVHAKVAGALPDAQPFLDAAADADDPWEVGTVALQLLSVARLPGIVDLDQRAGETSAQRSQREEDESAAATANLDRLRLATPVLADRESYEQVRSSGQPRSAESFRRGDSKVASQEATDQLIRVSTASSCRRSRPPSPGSPPRVARPWPRSRSAGTSPNDTSPASCTPCSPPTNGGACSRASTRATSPPTRRCSSPAASTTGCTSAAPCAPDGRTQ